MKTFNTSASLIITIFASFNAYAINYEVIGPCSEKAVHSGTFNVVDLKVSVGQTSVAIFDQNKIPYIGNESGFNSIVNTPTGLDSIEVLSDTKMRAYGWCFSVNDIRPDVIAGEYLFTSNSDKLVWFYAYSTYDKGEWLDYCVPSYKIKAAQFCTK
ncbi:MAG: DUF4430 domain-containing protein [Bacteriovorax sp.]|nr:DUF4430 domain-containing protein [Bacteriovorax sp.]